MTEVQNSFFQMFEKILKCSSLGIDIMDKGDRLALTKTIENHLNTQCWVNRRSHSVV